MKSTQPVTLEELESRLPEIHASPTDGGRVEMIVRRPKAGKREVLESGALDVVAGLEGDNWYERRYWRTPEKPPHPDSQLTLMNARVIGAVAPDREHWPLAGDQLFVDLDLSRENLPSGTRLAFGSAIIEVTAKPHTGCKKFAERFGPDAVRFLSDKRHEALRLRGIYAKVIQPGTVTVGDVIVKQEEQNEPETAIPTRAKSQ